MSKAMLEALRVLNRDMFSGRWNEDDLRQLLEPRFGVVSDFESILRNLDRILDMDLRDQPPDGSVTGCNE